MSKSDVTAARDSAAETPRKVTAPVEAPREVAASTETPRKAAAPAETTLAEWAAARAAELEGLKDTRSLDGATVDSALRIVHDFLIERGVILFGGLAIDYALRSARSTPIYSDTERPDYDVYTPRHAVDAYELGDLLTRRGFPSVTVIRAIHPQTLRVRVDFVVVADIGYVPPAVFARIPTLTYRGLRLVHPDFQRCDMHLDLANPLKSPGLEEIFYRAPKVARRLRRFDETFPVGAAFEGTEPAASKSRAPKPAAPVSRGGGSVVVSAAFKGGIVFRALSGQAARSAYRAYYLRLRAQLPGLPAREALPTPPTAKIEGGVGSYHVSGEDPVVIVTGSEGARTASEYTPVAERRPFLDLRPATAEYRTKGGSRVIFETHHRVRPSVCRLGEADAPVFVVSPAALQLHLLFEAWSAHWDGDSAAAQEYLSQYREFGADVDAVRAALFAQQGVDPKKWTGLAARCPFGYPLGRLAGCTQTPHALMVLGFTARDLRRPPPDNCGQPIWGQSDTPPNFYFDAALKKAAAAAAKKKAADATADAAADAAADVAEIAAPPPPKIELPTFDYDSKPPEIWLRDGGVV